MTDTVNVPREDCPFCGDVTEVRAWDSDGWTAYKCCDGCDMRGPASAFKYDDVEEAKTDAVARWNRAILASAPKAEPVIDSVDKVMAVLNHWFDGYARIRRDADMVKQLAALIDSAQPEAQKGELVAWRVGNDGAVYRTEKEAWKHVDGWRNQGATCDDPQPLYDHLAPSSELLESMSETWEISYGEPNGEEYDSAWMVHEVRGNINDREWVLLAYADTPTEALRLALAKHKGPQ